MHGESNSIDLPHGHDVIYQDDELVISFLPYDDDQREYFDEECDGYLGGEVYFWFFDVDEDKEDFPLIWNAYEDNAIVLEESDPPGEPVAMLSVVSALGEEQRLMICAKAASMLAKRFKKPLQAIKGRRLGENQEVLYDSDGCVSILTKVPEGYGGLQVVSVYWDKWKDAEPAVWQDDLRGSILTHEFPQGRYALLPVVSGGLSNVARVVPMELAEILAKRFGKRLEPPTRPTDSPSLERTSEADRGKSGGCASVLCLLLGVSVVVSALIASESGTNVAGKANAEQGAAPQLHDPRRSSFIRD
jgi:hypothetical protein